ncbi:MAG TPA: carboxypeptidase-like regulatory domain-containing protein, partial [Bacteroidales bacterium]|nr:carboxypeptidase-like regulatory domain-containing protein [Bacteroidales bacterium]
MKRILSLLVCLLAFSWFATFGQDVQIKGTITSGEDGSSLPGVYVKIKGTNTGTATDANGKYQVTAPSNATLVFSSIGFKDQEVEVAGQSTIDVVMSSDVTQMDEVVVTALGIKREKREVTYQTQKVSNEDILQAAPTRAANALTGKVAGLQINNMDNGVNPTTQITLRGFRSISGNNSATVVIDGSIASLGALDDLNPNDIEDINVLKGANAAALYGSKASNGALIVTTKKGTANQKFTVGVNSSYTMEKVAYMPDFQTEYGTGWEGAYDPIENTNWGPRFDGTMRQIGPTLPDGTFQEVPYAPVKDNLLAFFENGDTWTNTAYVSGGDANSTFYVSAGQQNSDGIVPDDAYKRYTFRANATKKIGKLELAFNSTYFTDHTDIVGSTIGDQDRPLYWFLLNTSANIPLSRYKNWRTDKWATPDTYYNGYYENPYWAVGTNRNIDDSRRLMANLAVSYDVLPWMKLTVRGAMNNSWGNGKNWRARQEYEDYRTGNSTVSSFVEDF